jgi:hypothetical protein
MKESEAKTKWCPMMPRGHRANRASQGSVREDLSCVGSACMVWRSLTERETSDSGAVIKDTVVGGYCGLAK